MRSATTGAGTGAGAAAAAAANTAAMAGGSAQAGDDGAGQNTPDGSTRQDDASASPPAALAAAAPADPSAAATAMAQAAPAAAVPIAGAAGQTAAGQATGGKAQLSPTIANLSAQISQQAGQKVTRFDVQLTPEGLGRVDVAVQIDASGKVTASLSFENADAAALVKDQSSQLQSALESAGLSLSTDSLKISHAQPDTAPATTAAAQQTVAANTSAAGSGSQFGSNGGGTASQHAFAGGQSLLSGDQSGGQFGGQAGQQDRPTGSSFAVQTFATAAAAADGADLQAAYASNLSSRGLDIRI